MYFKVIFIGLCLAATGGVQADILDQAIQEEMDGLTMVESDKPYSRTIKRMYIGWNENGEATVGIACREIESYKPITAVVVVHKTQEGFVLYKAAFPDIGKIKKATDRKEVLSVLKLFQNVPFDPHAEKSAVDTISGATRYGIKTSGYLNYMARRIALELELLPAWTQPKN